MRSFLFISIALLALSLSTQSQEYRPQRRKADSLYKAGDYQGALPLYLKLAIKADFKLQRTGSLYAAGCCYSLTGKKDSAFSTLQESIHQGYSDRDHLMKDKDLNALHGEKDWDKLVQSVKEEKKVLNNDPQKASLITDDVHRFWEAYDLAQKDTANRVAIYKKYYFEKSSRGMQDYMGLKVSSINSFVQHYDKRPLFYRAIRNNTFQTDSLKPAIYASFEKLKTIYPPAIFPDIYFIMGAYTSGGTTTDAGLLIGVNQVCRTDDIPLSELNLWEKNNFIYLKDLPGIVAHELIHIEQDSLLLSDDTTTLNAVLVEGMADFLGEMISGKNLNQRLNTWAKGKEKRIWQKFTSDMYLNRYDNWIANANQETPDNPADQGYWIGYQICRAYYMNATDKQQAIYEMLHFKNAREFLKKSKWEEMLASYN
jgi:predicted Zn-dependent protease DUF2268